MAKLTGPFFSLGASGAIAKTLVAFPWKGLNCLRKYVVPANPKTTAQTTQRDYLKACVAAIHAAMVAVAIKIKLADKTAYSLKGSTFPTPRTWFNQICKNWLDVKVAGAIPCIFCSGEMDNASKDDFRPHIYFAEEVASSLADGTFYLGTSKTAVIATKAGVITPGAGAALNVAGGFSGLSLGMKYYWWFKADDADPCEGAESGIYFAVTD